jgi:hypothetical protein
MKQIIKLMKENKKYLKIQIVIYWMILFIITFPFRYLDKKGIIFNNIEFLGILKNLNYYVLISNFLFLAGIIIFLVLFYYKISKTWKYFIIFIIILLINIIFLNSLAQYSSYNGEYFAKGIPLYNLDNYNIDYMFYTIFYFIKFIFYIFIIFVVYINKDYFNNKNEK